MISGGDKQQVAVSMRLCQADSAPVCTSQPVLFLTLIGPLFLIWMEGVVTAEEIDMDGWMDWVTISS